MIVRAFKKVQERRPDATLTFVGSALPGEAPWVVPDIPGLRKVGWTDDPYPIVASADLLVQASRREGFSMAVAEAILLGVRVIAVPNRGVRQIERRKIDGLLVVANDWRHLADAMESCLARSGPIDASSGLAESWSVEHAVGFHTDVILKTLEANPGTR